MGVLMAWARREGSHRLQRPCLGVVVLCFALASAGQARGGDPPRDPKQEAKARFVSGQSHYNLNEFTQAQQEFKEGYRLFPDPVFLFNLGQCERQLGHPEEAIRFYRSFLREQPKAPNRQEVLHKIEEMEAVLKAKQAEEDKGAAPAPGLEPGKAGAPVTPVPALPLPATPATVTKPVPAAPATAAGQKPAAGPATPPAAEPLPALPPVKPEGGEGTQAGIDLSQSPTTPSETTVSPIYKRWWFWTAAAAVAVGAGIGIYAATSSKGVDVPGSTLGSKKVF
jgi:hypothetical protein